MRRVLWLAVLIVAWLCGFAVDARAEGLVQPNTSPGTYWTNSVQGPNVQYLSQQGACEGGVAAINAAGGNFNYNNGAYEQVTFWFISGPDCVWSGNKYGDSGTFGAGSQVGQVTTCPANSTQTPEGCTCVSGSVPDATGKLCLSPQTVCPGVASGMSGTYYSTSGGAGLQLCSHNCTINAGISGSDSSGTYFGGPYTSAGTACSGTSSPGTTALSPGNCPGTVNGVAVPGGVPCQSTTSGTSTSTTPTTTTTASAPAGSTNGSTTTSTTTCSGGECTTTTTTTTTTGVGADGTGGTATTGTGTSTQSQNAFCAENPTDPQCAAASFGGSCSSDFTCTGDAVSCATAKVEYESTCIFNASPSASAAAKYSSLKGVLKVQDSPGMDTTLSSVDSLLPAAPAAVCAVQDLSIPFGSGLAAMTLTLPLGTYLCPKLALIRAVIVGFGSLMFILIVFVRS